MKKGRRKPQSLPAIITVILFYLEQKEPERFNQYLDQITNGEGEPADEFLASHRRKTAQKSEEYNKNQSEENDYPRSIDFFTITQIK